MHRPQDRDLIRGFNPFRDHAHAERMRHRDDRGEEYLSLLGFFESPGERLVNLENVEIEQLKLRQGRVSGTEVVDQELDSKLPDGGQRLDDVRIGPIIDDSVSSISSRFGSRL